MGAGASSASRMNREMIGRKLIWLIYLVLLGSGLIDDLFLDEHQKIGWVSPLALSLLMGIGGAYLLHRLRRKWDEFRLRRAVVVRNGQIIAPRAPDNHFYLWLDVGGTKIRFIVDTGASGIMLVGHDADRLGINRRKLDYVATVSTANGQMRTALVTLPNVHLQGVPFGNVAAWVGGGLLDVSLLGMEFLNRFAKVEMEQDHLILTAVWLTPRR